jgi:predicted secreted protein
VARYAGKSGILYLSADGAAAATNVGGMTRWSIDMSTDRIDVTAMGDTNKQSVIGLPNAQASMSFWWEDNINHVFTASQVAGGSFFYLYPSSNAATEYFYGSCWVDYSMEAAVDGAVGYTVNLGANSAWTFKQAA